MIHDYSTFNISSTISSDTFFVHAGLLQTLHTCKYLGTVPSMRIFFSAWVVCRWSEKPAPGWESSSASVHTTLTTASWNILKITRLICWYFGIAEILNSSNMVLSHAAIFHISNCHLTLKCDGCLLLFHWVRNSSKHYTFLTLSRCIGGGTQTGSCKGGCCICIVWRFSSLTKSSTCMDGGRLVLGGRDRKRSCPRPDTIPCVIMPRPRIGATVDQI